MDLDNKVFIYINSYEVPGFVTDLAIYLHGYRSVEVAFFIFCLLLTAILLGSPQKGIRAAVAVFVATMCSYFGAGYMRGLLSRPFPYLDENLASQLRVEPLSNLSAFPVTSVVLASSVAVALIYYFPKYSSFVVIASIVYTLMPIHLGVAFPSDAFGSLALGYAFSYFMMTALGKKDYFKRF